MNSMITEPLADAIFDLRDQVDERTQRITDLESALRYIRNELTRWHCTIGFDHILDRIDSVLPDRLTQDIAEWCSTYDKRVVVVSVNGKTRIDPNFAKEMQS